MFIEPHLVGERRGWIEVICGSMFSGKTEELIRRLKRAKIANLKVEIFKPVMDTRYHEQHIVSHDENAILSTPVDNSQTILLLAGDVHVVGIDEAQFFDDQLPDVCDQLAVRGVRVIAAGLDMDDLSGRCHSCWPKQNISPSYMPFASNVETLRTIPIERNLYPA
jgi:thymidine kinase